MKHSFLRSVLPRRTVCRAMLAAALFSPFMGHPAWAVHMPKVPELPASALVPFMQSNQQIWDAVLPLPDGRMLLEAPAWVGNTGPQLWVRQTNGSLAPYPNADWNNREATNDTHFVALAGMTRTADGSIWVLDSGVPNREKPPVAAPRLIQIDPTTNTVTHTVPIEANLLHQGSILSGIAVHGSTAYVPDSGVAGLLLIDIPSVSGRRFLDHHPALTATKPIQTPTGPLLNANGQAIAVDTSMIAVSPDGTWIVMQPPAGFLYRVSTSLFTDPDVTPAAFEEGVTQWYKTPALGGLTIDNDGTLYWSDITTGSILSYTVGRIPRRLVTDERLKWPTTPGLDGHGHLYVAASQLDHSVGFGAATPSISWPITVYQLTLPTTPPPQ